jgi:hypothetical protein
MSPEDSLAILAGSPMSMPRHFLQRTLLLAAGLASAIFVAPGPAAAQVQEANPSFSNTLNDLIDFKDFGEFRQGAAAPAAYSFDVYNVAAPSGTTSPMSLTNVQSFGSTSSFTLQTGTVSGLTPGNFATMQLSLSTAVAGDLQVNYTMSFDSDAIGGQQLKHLTISGYAKVYPIGDFDKDFDVDHADHALWRSKFGTSDAVADANLNGVDDAADYVLWRRFFTGPLGSSGGPGAALTPTSAIPEPASLGLALAALFCTCGRRGRRQRR